MEKAKKCASRTVKIPIKKVSKPLLTSFSNPDRARRWHLQHAIGHHFDKFKVPVDHLEIKRWKDQPLKQELGGLSISLQMRFFAQALQEKTVQQDGWMLGFLTVNFSQALTENIANEKTRSPAGKYANRVNNKFRKHGVRAEWFGALEDHKGNLHCHGLIGFHKDDASKIKRCLKADTDMASGIRLQTTYSLRRQKRPSPVGKQLSTAKTHISDLPQEVNVDMGAPDYMSKTLEKHSKYMDTGKCRLYVPNWLRSAAELRFEDMRNKQNRFRSAPFDTTTLNCHQALTYMLRGWVPEAISAYEARLDEQRITDIDENLAWEHFRNSEPAYDWQYEEDDPSFDAYFDAVQEMAEGLSEGEYDRVVEEAEHLIDQSANTEEMTEGEYDWLMSEIAVIAKEHEKARSLSEGQYEALMQVIGSDLEQYHQDELSWQAPNESAVSDAELDVFMKQQALTVPEKRSITPEQSRSISPRSTTDKKVIHAILADNNPPEQPCMARQINAAYGARRPPQAASTNPPYSSQIAHLRHFRAWGISAYRRAKKTPLNASRGVIKRCPLYQLSSMKPEWPPPTPSTCQS